VLLCAQEALEKCKDIELPAPRSEASYAGSKPTLTATVDGMPGVVVVAGQDPVQGKKIVLSMDAGLTAGGGSGGW
jgi:hypothetical protein